MTLTLNYKKLVFIYLNKFSLKFSSMTVFYLFFMIIKDLPRPMVRHEMQIK